MDTLLRPEGAKCATSVNVQLPCLQKDLRSGSISRDMVNLSSELCRRRSGHGFECYEHCCIVFSLLTAFTGCAQRVVERLAEYAWKTHGYCWTQRSLSRASIYWYVREQQRGTVSSSSRFPTAPFRQYSANLSVLHSLANMQPMYMLLCVYIHIYIYIYIHMSYVYTVNKSLYMYNYTQIALPWLPIRHPLSKTAQKYNWGSLSRAFAAKAWHPSPME